MMENNITINSGHIEHLIALENDKVQEAWNNYSTHLKVADDIIYFLSREFVDTTSDKNVIFMSFFTQISVDLELAMLSTIRRHDIQACMMLRHALESIPLAAYSLFSKQVIDKCGIVAEFGNTGKACDWIKNNYPEHSENIKGIKGKINNHYSHANITTAAPNLIIGDDKTFSCFFDSNSDKTLPKRLYIISEIAWLALDLIDKAIGKTNGGVVLNKDSDQKIKDFGEQIDSVFSDKS